MRLPSLDISNDNFWIPVNAIIQKQLSPPPPSPPPPPPPPPPDNTCEAQTTACCDTPENDLELPSVAKPCIDGADIKPRIIEGGFPVRKRTLPRKPSKGQNKNSLFRAYSEKSREGSALLSDVGKRRRSASHPANTASMAAASKRHHSGCGRLLSGKLKPGSSRAAGRSAVHLENLQDLAIGIPKSPYEKLVSKMAAMARTKMSIQELYSSSKKLGGESYDANTASCTKPKGVDESTSATHLPSSKEELPLNKLSIMQESSSNDGEALAITESAIFSGPAASTELAEEKVIVAAGEEDKPKNVAITFSKPHQLFCMKSVQKKMCQHTFTDKTPANKTTPHSRGHTARERQPSSSQLQNCKHRLALNKSRGGQEEGVFGTRPPVQSCVVRSQERRKLQLKTVAAASSSLGNHSTGSRKVQVYLIKTRRPLEEILPKFGTSQVQDGLDLYAE